MLALLYNNTVLFLVGGYRGLLLLESLADA
jgi:hypothetical protein